MQDDFFHVRISRKSVPGRDEVRLDYTLVTLQQRILEPYESNQPIVINGTSIHPSDIDRLLITSTSAGSNVLRPAIKAKLADSRVFHFDRTEDWFIADSGNDVTDDFVSGPPGSRGPNATNIASTTAADPQKVFVVHGRDIALRDAVFAFLRSIDLKPIEWSEAVRATGEASPYVGTILDKAFAMAKAVLVLISPDDEARLRTQFRRDSDPTYEKTLTGQARPNVLFEAGMAMGLQPTRTVIAEIGVLRPFSDITGRHTLRLDNSAAKRQELAERLETAGCTVNLRGTSWHTAGDIKPTS